MVKKITGGVRKLETHVILPVTVADPGSTEGKIRRVKTLVRLCFASNKTPLMTTQLLDNGAGCEPKKSCSLSNWRDEENRLIPVGPVCVCGESNSSSVGKKKKKASFWFLESSFNGEEKRKAKGRRPRKPAKQREKQNISTAYDRSVNHTGQ